jgi:hypothetical protein
VKAKKLCKHPLSAYFFAVSSTFEEMYFPLVLHGSRARGKSAQVAPLSRFGIY